MAKKKESATAACKVVDVPYYQQIDRNTYCGPACLEMMLASQAMPIPTSKSPADIKTEQDQLTVSLSSMASRVDLPDKNWISNPYSVMGVLNQRTGASRKWYDLAFDRDSADFVTRQIVWSLFRYDQPCCAAVFNANHWIVVFGCSVSRPPTDANDNGYDIHSLFIHDPNVPESMYTGATAPDTDQSGCLRSPGLCVDFDPRWTGNYLTKVSRGRFGNDFLAIVGADAPGVLPDGTTGIDATHGVESRMMAVAVDRSISPKPTVFITPKKAIAQAKRWCKNFGANKKQTSGDLKMTAAEPFLVRHLDRVGGYYIVPFSRGASDRVSAFVRVDARTGVPVDGFLHPNPQADLLANLNFTEDKIRANIDVAAARVSGLLDGWVRYPNLVWASCTESGSPFFPFHIVLAGEQRIYVRVDGQSFPELTPISNSQSVNPPTA